MLGKKMTFGILLVLSACLSFAFCFEHEKILENFEIFKKCMDHACPNESLLEEELNCMSKLSKKDIEFSTKEASECYGITEINVDTAKVICQDLPKAYECSKKCMEKFKALERNEEEQAQLEEYEECVKPLYQQCLE